MARQPNYKQVSLTPQAHRALQQLTYTLSAELADRVTLSQAVLICKQMVLTSMDLEIARCAREVGIEPNADV